PNADEFRLVPSTVYRIRGFPISYCSISSRCCPRSVAALRKIFERFKSRGQEWPRCFWVQSFVDVFSSDVSEHFKQETCGRALNGSKGRRGGCDGAVVVDCNRRSAGEGHLQKMVSIHCERSGDGGS